MRALRIFLLLCCFRLSGIAAVLSAESDPWWGEKPEVAAAQWLARSRADPKVAALQMRELLQALEVGHDPWCATAWSSLAGQPEFRDALGRMILVPKPEDIVPALARVKGSLPATLASLAEDRGIAQEARRRALLALRGCHDRRIARGIFEQVALRADEPPELRAAAAEVVLVCEANLDGEWERLRAAYEQAVHPAVQAGLLRLFGSVDDLEPVQMALEEARRVGTGVVIHAAALEALIDAARRAGEQRDRARLDPVAGFARDHLLHSTAPMDEAAALCILRASDPPAFHQAMKPLRDDPAAWERMLIAPPADRWWLEAYQRGNGWPDRQPGESEWRAVQMFARLPRAPWPLPKLMERFFEVRPDWLAEAIVLGLRDPARRPGRERALRLVALLPSSEEDLQAWEAWQAVAVALADHWGIPRADDALNSILQRGLGSAAGRRRIVEAAAQLCRAEPELWPQLLHARTPELRAAAEGAQTAGKQTPGR